MMRAAVFARILKIGQRFSLASGQTYALAGANGPGGLISRSSQ
jgi:hypothetical protein